MVFPRHCLKFVAIECWKTLCKSRCGLYSDVKGGLIFFCWMCKLLYFTIWLPCITKFSTLSGHNQATKGWLLKKPYTLFYKTRIIFQITIIFLVQLKKNCNLNKIEEIKSCSRSFSFKRDGSLIKHYTEMHLAFGLAVVSRHSF